ncbi:Fic family protein [Phytobacter sp. V91]|uniref:Fic family protein n=1 Tax=Phytobacter sp. V91 TaxID=3369425 RepID=UPI003F5E0EA0
MTIKSPPTLIQLSDITSSDLSRHLKYNRLTDEKGRYLPFDAFQYRVKKGDDVNIAWTMTRLARNAAILRIDYHNESGEEAGFNIPRAIYAVCEAVDKHATALALKEQKERLRGAGAELNPLSLEEPITSSQLEGANTTSLVARSMLESGRTPRTEDEQMIVGNARLMTEISGLRNEPLTPALIRRFHATGMGGINDAKYRPGEWRDTDDIVIADYDGNIVHQPPRAADLEERLERVCDWLNTPGEYIHPLIRACILHFMIAHEHPFRDGNGRTSRGLFYWYMLKSGYDVFKYISVSRLLHAAPVKYAHSYQFTETDAMDLTYFIEYQVSVVGRALTDYLDHIAMLTRQSAMLDSQLYDSGVMGKLTPRQVTLLNVMLSTPGKEYTAAQISASLHVSDNTARNDLRALVRQGCAREIKVNAQMTTYVAHINR